MYTASRDLGLGSVAPCSRQSKVPITSRFHSEDSTKQVEKDAGHRAHRQRTGIIIGRAMTPHGVRQVMSAATRRAGIATVSSPHWLHHASPSHCPCPARAVCRSLSGRIGSLPPVTNPGNELGLLQHPMVGAATDTRVGYRRRLNVDHKGKLLCASDLHQLGYGHPILRPVSKTPFPKPTGDRQ